MKLLVNSPVRDGLADICMICKNRGDCWDLSEYTQSCKRFVLDEDRASSLESQPIRKE